MLGVGGVLAQAGQLGPVQRHRRDGRGLEQLRGGRGQRRAGLLLGHDLAEHAEQLHPQLVRGLEAVGGVGGAALGDQAVERVVVAEQRRGLGVGQRGEVRRLVALELHAQHDERAADRVDVGRDARPDRRDLGRLVADRAVDRRLLVVDVAYAAEVDQLERVADLDQVVRLEVAVDEAEVVEVLEGRQDLEDVGQRLVDGQRVVGPAVGPHPLLEHLLERPAADVLHDDVAGLAVGDEVVDLDDQRVLDLREEALLGDGGRERVGVAGVEQALEHHPAVGDVLVAGQVDPAEAAVGQAAGDLVLPGDQVAGVQLGGEGELLAARRAEALGAPRTAVLAAPDGDRRTWHRCACPPAPRGSSSRPWRRPPSGIGGIVVRPAPRRAERSRWEPVRTRWVALVPAAAASRSPRTPAGTNHWPRPLRPGRPGTRPPSRPQGHRPAYRRRRSSRRRSCRCTRAAAPRQPLAGSAGRGRRASACHETR